jgi:hypothetical protein
METPNYKKRLNSDRACRGFYEVPPKTGGERFILRNLNYRSSQESDKICSCKMISVREAFSLRSSYFESSLHSYSFLIDLYYLHGSIFSTYAETDMQNHSINHGRAVRNRTSIQ